jgi:hypothetical protein
VANHTVKNGYKSAFSSDKIIRLDASGDPGIFLTPDPGLLGTIFLFKILKFFDQGIFLTPDSG